MGTEFMHAWHVSGFPASSFRSAVHGMVDKSLVYQTANSEQTVHDFLCFSTAHHADYHIRILQQAESHHFVGIIPLRALSAPD